MLRATNREIKSFDDMTMLDIDQQVALLDGLVTAQAARLEKQQASKGKPESKP